MKATCDYKLFLWSPKQRYRWLALLVYHALGLGCVVRTAVIGKRLG